MHLSDVKSKNEQGAIAHFFVPESGYYYPKMSKGGYFGRVISVDIMRKYRERSSILHLSV